MSPEQVTTGMSVDTRTDLWSLAVVFYAALCGQKPFGHDELDELKIQNNQLQVQNRALKRRGAAEETNAEDAAARTTALVALKAEMELLRKFSDMASGGRWLARWRIWLAGLKRKRAEFRAAASSLRRSVNRISVAGRSLGADSQPSA